MSNVKYKLLKRQYSINGVNWIDIKPNVYKIGDVIESSSNCQGQSVEQYRWVKSAYYECEGTTKYDLEIKQISTDGVIWNNVMPLEYRRGSKVYYNSTDCGYIQYYFSVNPNSYNLSKEYHNITTRLTSSRNDEFVDYTVTPKVNWISVSKNSNSLGIYVRENNNSAKREGEIELVQSGSNKKLTITITQEKGDGVEGDYIFQAEKDSYHFDYEGENEDAFNGTRVLITSTYQGNDIMYDVIETPSWLTVRPFSTAVVFECQPNYNEANRNGKVILQQSGSGLLIEIEITQDGTENITYRWFDVENEFICEEETPTDGNTRWYNGNNRIKTVNVIGELTEEYKESACTRCEIGNNVTSIGASAFTDCSILTSVTIPNSVTSIGNSAFRYCSGLTRIDIPNSVESIGERAFDFCKSLTSVTIPNSVIEIGAEAFYYCSGVTSLDIPNSVTSIDRGAFSMCESLTSITIPNSVTNFGAAVFRGCILISSIELPSGITSIKEQTFQNCNSLTSITIPNSVTSIKTEAFSYCSYLESISIPNSVTTIGYYTFLNCKRLTSIDIGSGVTSIGDWAFSLCTSLTSINYNGTIAQWNAITKGSYWNNRVPTSCIVHCTDGDTPI